MGSKNRRYKIGVMGPPQIEHIKPILSEEYDVIDLQCALEHKNKALRVINLVFRILFIDILYIVYVSDYTLEKAKLARWLGKKVFVHWIGTDAYDALTGKFDKSNLANVDYSFSCFTGIAEELLEIGIETHVLPIIPFNYAFSMSPMPEKHSVLIYMPNEKEDFYGLKEFDIVFKVLKDLPFYIVANDNVALFEKYDNVRCLGKLSLPEMEDLYSKITIVLRCPKHDGLSMSVIEALAKGKRVIWNYQHPYVDYAENSTQIINKLKDILKTSPVANIDACNYINSEYSKEKYLELFSKGKEAIER